MPHKIDSQMLQIHQRCTQGSSEGGKKISEKDALQLVRRAHEINEAQSSSYSSDSARGNKYLLRMMDQYGKDFSPESQNLIQKYIRTGKVPTSQAGSVGVPSTGGGISHGGGHSGGIGHGGYGGGRPHGGVPTTGPSHGGVPTHGGSHGAGDPSHPSDPSVGGSAGGGANAGPSGPTMPTPTTPTTPVGGDDVGTVGPNGKVILDFRASKSTWGCHWFPMQETRAGGDPTNNLYAVGGPLDKLDKVTGGNARQYEWNNNRKAVDAGREYSWWGHCNNASEAACILPEPKHSVVMTGRDGSQVKFSKNDIQGLLVKCTPGLITRVDFKGERFNTPSRDNPNDPAPAMFIQVMKDWSDEGIPFVLDIDRSEQVWNFPYDQVKISESDNAPQGVSVPSGAKYYHIEMSGTGFPEKARIYECWVAADGSSEWVKTPNTHNNPDFMWRPHAIGDIMDKTTWQLRGRPSNPEVDPQMVYEIYMKSLA